jgi:hypothetical protein
MKFGPDNYNHEERCSQGHSSASTIATIEAALSADPDIDNSAIEIRMLGPVVLLEGFINKAADRDKAISLAAVIVGWENVGPGMKTGMAIRTERTVPSRPDETTSWTARA